MWKYHDDGVKEKARQMFSEGLTKAEIARQLGIAKSTVKQWLPQHSKPEHDFHWVEIARQLYDEGMSIRTIAKKLEVAHGTVRGWVTYSTRTHG